MFAKDNQPTLRSDIEALFQRASTHRSSKRDERNERREEFSYLLHSQHVQVVGDMGQGVQIREALTQEVAHGRIKRRSLEVMLVPSWACWLDWPGVQQIFRIQRSTRFKKSGRERGEMVYGLTSLSEEQISPEGLLQLCRGHGSIENRSHWVRDVSFDEDRSTFARGVFHRSWRPCAIPPSAF